MNHASQLCRALESVTTTCARADDTWYKPLYASRETARKAARRLATAGHAALTLDRFRPIYAGKHGLFAVALQRWYGKPTGYVYIVGPRGWSICVGVTTLE